MSSERPDPEDGAGQRDNSSDTRIVITLAAVGVGFGFFLLLLFGFGNRDDVAPPELDLIGVSSEVAAALTQARQWVLANPASAPAWGQLGMELRAHEFGSEAEFCYEQAERLDPHDWRWPYLLGVNRTYTDEEDAKSCFRRAVALRPDYAPARHRLAELLLGQTLLAEAKQQLDEVIRRSPDDPRALLGLARVEWQNENVDASRIWAEKSAALRAGQRATHELLSQIYHELGHPQSVQRQLDILKELPPGKTNWEDPLVAEVLSMRRDAEFIVQQAQALFESGRRQRNRGQMQHAIQMMQRPVQQHPERLEFGAELSRMLILVEDLTRAAQVLDEALDQHPGTAELLRLRGLVYFARKQWQPAARCFREAIRYKPDHAEAHDNLGRCLVQLQDTENAIRAFRNAIRFEPALARAHANLGSLLLEQGDRLAAIEHLRTAVDLKVDDAAATERLLEKALAAASDAE